jgi:RimJ/RimL family protein N-acetyltransferase
MIQGGKVKLFPYRREHVPQYHEWMKDPYILEMTASEPLTLEEEYEMQQDWLIDEKKCTFIILRQVSEPSSMTWGIYLSQGVTIDTVKSMVGDCNLFFNDPDCARCCEIEVMIADALCRGKGMATEAVLLMMAYGIKQLKVERFYCKISDQNKASIHLFKKMNYSHVNYVEAFKEHEYELIVTPEKAQQIIDATTHCSYDWNV